MKIGERVKVHRSELVPTRENEVSREKVDLAKERILTEGLVRIVKGRRVKNGKIQIGGGHHLLVALEELHYDALVDVQLYEDCTQEEFGKMYLRDNSAIDNNCTRWALHAVAHPADLLGDKYTKESSEMDANLARHMGVRLDVIPALRDMAAAIKAKALAPEVANILSIDIAVYFWRRVATVGGIPLDAQKMYLLDRLLPGLRLAAPKDVAIKDPTTTIRKWSNAFDPDFGKKIERAKPSLKVQRELSLDERGDKVRMALEDFVNIIEATEDPELDDEIQDKLLSLCGRFIGICEGAETEVSNG